MEKIKNFLLKNTSTKQTVAKNTFWLFFGEIIGRLLKLFIVVFATRKLGVEGWGLFSYTLAFVGFFYFLGDFGLSTFITREMSKDNANKYKYLSTSFIVRAILLLIFFITSLLIAPHIGNIRLSFATVLVFSTFFVSESLRDFAMSINRSLEKMEREGFSKILINLIITILGVILILKNRIPLSLALAYMIGSIVATIYIFWSIRQELRMLDWKFSKENLKIMYDFSWPLIIIGLFSFIFNLDDIMLGQMRSAMDVGLYAAAERLVQFSTIIPGFIATATFPTFSKNEHNAKKMTAIFEKIMTVVVTIGIPITIGGLFFSQQIILLILGRQYIAAWPVFSILMISTLASFPNIILTNVIFSKNLQKIFVLATSFGLALNIILNLWLIPKYGAIGAGISTTATQLLIMSINWRKLKKFMEFSILPKLGKILLANICMICIILLCNLIGMNFVITITISIITYGFFLYFLNEPSFEELITAVKKN